MFFNVKAACDSNMFYQQTNNTQILKPVQYTIDVLKRLNNAYSEKNLGNLVLSEVQNSIHNKDLSHCNHHLKLLYPNLT